MKIKKVILTIMIVALIFPSTATTLSYAVCGEKASTNTEENIYEQLENTTQSKEENIKEETKNEDENYYENSEKNTEENIKKDINDEENVIEDIDDEEKVIEHIDDEKNIIEDENKQSIEKNIEEANEDISLNKKVLQSKMSTSLTIEEGIYYIRTKLDENKVFDIASQSNLNCANVQIWDKSAQKTKNQMFKIAKTSDGYYKIEAVHSGKILEVAGAKTQNCTNIQQYEYNGTAAQKWKIVDAGNGYISFVSVCNDLYIDIAGASKKNGANVQVYEANSTDSQKFKLEVIEKSTNIEIEDGTYYIHTKLDNNKVFDIAGQSNLNCANVQIWDKSAQKTKNQMFKIAKTSDGYYKIEAMHSGKALDVVGASKQNCANIQQYGYNGTTAQKWKIVDAGNGYISFVSVCNDLYIDIAGASKQNGANVQVYEKNGTDSQRFKLEKIEQKPVVGTKTIPDGTYKIKMATDTSIGLDIDGLSKKDKANVQLWTESKVVSKNQRFEITYQKDGYYKIIAQHSGKALEVTEMANVQQYESNEKDSQKWVIKYNEDKTYTIISKLNGLCLDVESGIIKDGSNVQVYEENGSNAQKFIFEKVEKATCREVLESGVYKISTKLNSNMYLDIAEGSYNNQANLQIWDGGIVQQKKFQVTYIKEGYYEIKSVNSGKVLDVASGRNDDGTNVQQYESNNTDYQKWILQDAGNGYFYVLSRGADAYLDIAGGQGRNGANVQIYGGNQSNAQKFKFEEVKPLEEDIYEIAIAKDHSMQVDVDIASSNVQIWKANHSTSNQKFSLEYLGNKYYKIVSSKTKQVLTVEGTNVRQNTYKGTDNQQWQIEVGNDGYFLLKSKSTGLYLTLANGSTTNGTNIQVYKKDGTDAQFFKFTKFVFISDFSTLDETKYPGYKALLRELQIQHPTWTFNIYNTGMDWNTAVNSQNDTRSLVEYVWVNESGEWKDAEDNNQYEKGWYKASRKAIAYMMDPRNSLDEGYIFQFQDLSSASCSRADIAKMVSGTFLNTDSIINTVIEVAQVQKISPFHIVSRMLQEIGRNGSGTMNGYDYNGTKVYNLFNINVYGDNGFEKGAKYAYDKGWFTPEACIRGGAEFLKANYIGKGQSTLYFQKYNVITEPFYQHQYMTNIRAANDEGNTIYKSYKNNGLLDSYFTFTIPIYENMPQNACPRPGR